MLVLHDLSRDLKAQGAATAAKIGVVHERAAKMGVDHESARS